MEKEKKGRHVCSVKQNRQPCRIKFPNLTNKLRLLIEASEPISSSILHRKHHGL